MNQLAASFVGAFLPDKRMEEFRKLARNQYDSGNLMVAGWCKASTSAMKRGVSITEWRQWEALDGFQDWWSELFPEFGGITIADLRAAEHEFWAGMVEGLVAREAWAFGIYAKAASAQKAAEQHNQSQLEEWLEESPASGWITQTAEAK